MKWRTLMALALFIVPALLVSCSSDDDPAGPVLPTGHVSVESVTAAPGETVQLDVTITASADIQIVQIPIEIVGDDCTLDEITFGANLPQALAAPFTQNDYDPDPMRMNMIWTGMFPIDAGVNEVFATLEVTIDADAPAQEIRFEAYTYIAEYLGQMAQHQVGFATPDQTVIIPTFDVGTITVQP